jgi:general secretion pathway protein B
VSFILDALRKSEDVRENRKTRGLLEEGVEVTAVIPPSEQSKTSTRRSYILAFTLLLNAGFFVFWLCPWQWGGNANVSGIRNSGGQFPETRRQEAPSIRPGPLPQLQVNQEATESRAGDKENSAPNPPASGEVTAVSAPKPHGSKLPQSQKATGTKMGIKTANLKATPKNQAVRVEQPPAGSGIISDIQPSAKPGTSSGKPAFSQEQKWQELAPQIRAAFPNLSLSMLIYSRKPEDRWVNVDGTKKREGDEIAPGLNLDEITPEGAIFSSQGHRFFKGVVGD